MSCHLIVVWGVCMPQGSLGGVPSLVKDQYPISTYSFHNFYENNFQAQSGFWEGRLWWPEEWVSGLWFSLMMWFFWLSWAHWTGSQLSVKQLRWESGSLNPRPWSSARKKLGCPLRVGNEIVPWVEEFGHIGFLFLSARTVEWEIKATASVQHQQWWGFARVSHGNGA